MGGGFGGKESQATQWAATRRARRAEDGAGLQAPPRPRRRHDHDRQAPRLPRRSCRFGIDGEGRIAVAVNYFRRCGCSADLSQGSSTGRRSMLIELLPTRPRIVTQRLQTNTVSNTAFRGFGGPQASRGDGAHRRRRRLAPRHRPRRAPRQSLRRGPSATPYGMTVEDHVGRRLLGALEASSDCTARREAVRAFSRRPRRASPTPVKFGISFTLTHLNQAGALVHVYGDGSVQLNGGTEMGQGLNQKVAQIVAEEFGIGMDRVRITATTTRIGAQYGPTAAPAPTCNGGRADRGAEIRDRLAELAGRLLAPRPRRWRSGTIASSPATRAWRSGSHPPRLCRTGPHVGGRPLPDPQGGGTATMCAAGHSTTSPTARVARRRSSTRRQGREPCHPRCLLRRRPVAEPAIDIGQIEGGFVQGMGWRPPRNSSTTRKGARTHAPSTRSPSRRTSPPTCA